MFVMPVHLTTSLHMLFTFTHRCGVFAAAGSLAAESQPAAEAFAAAAAGSSGAGGSGSPSRRHGALQQEQLLPTYDVSFLAPLVCHAATGGAARVSAGGATEASSCGLARLRGAVQGVAFVGKRELAGKALAELRVGAVRAWVLCGVCGSGCIHRDRFDVRYVDAYKCR